jgi:hypothetical protein
MSFDEFLEYFNSLTICKINKKLKVKRNLIEFDYDKKYEINAFHLYVKNQAKYYIEVNLDDYNRTVVNIDLFFVIMSINENNELDEVIKQTEARHCRTAYLECELTEGSYLIVPMSFKYWHQRGKIIKYNLAVQSLRSIDLKQIKFNSSLLSHIIIKKCFEKPETYEEKYLIKEIIDPDGNACIYAIQMALGETDVTFIMAQNLNKKKHFSVQIEIKPNKFRFKYIKENTTPEVSFEIRELVEELQSTRNNLETRDLILLLNQRVIAIINHTKNIEKVFEDIMKDFNKYKCESVFLIEKFKIEIIESELIEETHVNIFTDYLHSNFPVENTISYYFIDK